MKTNLAKIKEAMFNFGCPREVSNEILAFEKELRQIFANPRLWLLENEDKIHARFEHHSVSGLSPKELLIFFIEKEILGE